MPKQECPAGVPDWVLTYGDMMSLLLCFFIMLYAISTLEVVKAQAVSDSIREALGGRKTGSNFPSRSMNSRSRLLNITQGGKPIVAPQGEHDRVMNIRDNAEQVRGGVIPFEFDSDELTDAAKASLETVAGQLRGAPYKIEIRGHASVTEKSIYPRYWDLGYTRAMAVKDHLVSLGIPDKYFRVASTGPYEPIGSSSISPDADPRAASSVVEVMQLLDTVRAYDGSKADQDRMYMNELPTGN